MELGGVGDIFRDTVLGFAPSRISGGLGGASSQPGRFDPEPAGLEFPRFP